jgi:hypothetical protein
MEAENMAAVESIGTRSRIKEQHEKYEKFVGHFFFLGKKENLC